jgi:molybdopterin molybdotransferase
VREIWPARRRARLAKAHASVVGREDYVRVRVVERDGARWAEPLAGGSAALSNVVLADGLVRVEASLAGVEAGTLVDVFEY